MGSAGSERLVLLLRVSMHGQGGRLWATDSREGRFSALSGSDRWLELARHDVAMDCSRRAASAVVACISRVL